MSTKPLITVHITSYNRFLQLRNLVQSLVYCNEYENIELIIVDNGSTDERLLKYYDEINLGFPFQLIRNEVNDYPRCVWHAKNQARAAANGDYFLDVPDDHQFVRRGNWIQECLDLYNSVDDIGCIVLYAYSIFRWTKSNNRLHPLSQSSGVPHFMSYYKGYVDYHFTSREVYERVGPFLDTGYDDRAIPEPDYMRRSTELGLRRLFLKYPASVAIPDHMDDSLNPFGYKPVFPYISLSDYDQWKDLPRPVSGEEIRLHSLAKHRLSDSDQDFSEAVQTAVENEQMGLSLYGSDTIFQSPIIRMGRQAARRFASRFRLTTRG